MSLEKIKIHDKRLDPHPTVCVLLCYHNGKKYIKEQLISIRNQIGVDVDIKIHDDKSDAKNIRYLRDLQKSIKFDLLTNEFSDKLGASNNFRHAILSTNHDYDYYSLSDQDDVWLPNKLITGINAMSNFDEPSMFCSRTILVNHDGRINKGLSASQSRGPSFCNALTQNIAGGNTMLLNKMAFKKLQVSLKNIDEVVYDWWIYLFLTGIGARVVFCSEPTVKYRQHSSNLVGANNSILSKYQRVVALLQGKYRVWNQQNIKALEKNQSELTSENRRVLKYYKAASQETFFKRIGSFFYSGVHRQTKISTIALLIAVLIKKV